LYYFFVFFFFFQAEDGIRDLIVTGVQTCALPICSTHVHYAFLRLHRQHNGHAYCYPRTHHVLCDWGTGFVYCHQENKDHITFLRSEERRVGKECRSWWVWEHYKKKEEIRYNNS